MSMMDMFDKNRIRRSKEKLVFDGGTGHFLQHLQQLEMKKEVKGIRELRSNYRQP